VAPLHSRNDSRALDQQRSLDPQRIFDLSQDLMCMTDAQGRFLRVGASVRRILGYAPGELLGRKLIDLVQPADVPRTLLAQDAVLRGGEVVEFENGCVRSDGIRVYLSWSASWVADGDGAGVCYAIARDITNRKRADVLREAHREVLQMIATGSALPEILWRICAIMESVDPEARCAVLLLDAQLAGAAVSPSLPSRFLTIVRERLLNGPSASRWGATLRSGQTVLCADIQSHPEWQGVSDLAAEHASSACWMTPVFGADGHLIATIGVFYSHHYEPARRELVVVQATASLVAVAIEHASARRQLASLADAARRMNSSLSAEELLQVVADIARDLVGAHVAIGVLRGNDSAPSSCAKSLIPKSIRASFSAQRCSIPPSLRPSSRLRAGRVELYTWPISARANSYATTSACWPNWRIWSR
jgi:PAS domain S-box-containing protein